jgi:hypothetical protein
MQSDKLLRNFRVAEWTSIVDIEKSPEGTMIVSEEEDINV